MVTFKGTLTKTKNQTPIVSAAIGIAVSLPDSTVDSISTTTGPDGSFSVDKEYPVGDYSAIAAFVGDATNNPGESERVSFTVAKDAVTLTLNITQA